MSDDEEFLDRLDSVDGELGVPIQAYRPPPPMRIKPARSGKAKRRGKKSSATGADDDADDVASPIGTCILYGLLGGFAAGLIWIAIGYLLHKDLGWMALGVGLGVGLGTRKAAQNQKDAASGSLAAVFSVMVIVICRFAVASLLATQFASALSDSSEDGIKRYLANSIMEDEVDDGSSIRGIASGHNWSRFKTLEEFPREIREETEERWESMSDEERDNVREDIERFQQFSVPALAASAFFTNFGKLDVLWTFLAAVTAFRIGSGAWRRR